MNRKLLLIVVFMVGCSGGGNQDNVPARNEFASLGRKIFFDTNLSSTREMSCATCHAPEAEFSDPAHTAVSNGAVSGRKGNRNTPTAKYALYSPTFRFSEDEGDFIGGQFLDGAAIDLENQAKRPLFSANEMNLANKEELRKRISEAVYVDEFKAIYGEQTLEDAEQTLSAVANAIAAFENSAELQPFSSKYDAYVAGQAQLTAQEARGLALFNAPNKGNCAACHPSTNPDGGLERALFTDFTYDNVGLPKNTNDNLSSDKGLKLTTGRPADIGRFKVPTLRNVDATAPYFHSGVFKSLKESVHFYNARDVDPKIAKPEFGENMNITELGDLGLSDKEEDDIVAFLKTLTDGYVP